MLLRQTLLYLPAQVLGPIFQLISAFAWTHVLAPAEMGSFALISAAQELAFATGLMWFANYTVRYFDANASDADKDRFHATETAVLIAACLAIGVCLAVLPLGASGPIRGELLAASLAFVLTRSLVSYLADRVRVEGDTLAYTILQSSGPVLGFFLGLALVSVRPPTAATVLWGYAIAQAASLVFAAGRLRFSARPHQGDSTLVRQAVAYGVPLFFGGLLVWIANNGLRFIIEWKEGVAAVGLVTVGWALGLRAAGFASMLTTAAAFPLAVKRAREDGLAAGQDQLVRNGVLLLATLAPAIAGLYVIGPPLIELIIAAPYRAITTQVLPVALATGALRAVRIHVANQVFLLHEKPLVPTVNDGLDAALTVLLGGLGLWLGGLQGCVVGVMIGSCVTLVTGFAAAWAWHAFTFPAVDFAKVAAATLAMSLAVASLAPAPSAASLSLAVLIGAAVYGAALAALYPAHALNAATLLQRRLARFEPFPRPSRAGPAASSTPSTQIPHP
jgi:O-antigen/teichoic acid export membrane protein